MLMPLYDLEARPDPVFEAEGVLVLRVSRCCDCGRQYLPARSHCLACGGADFVESDLPAAGTLYSFSTVHVSSSRPTPYTIGYIDLTQDLRILADVTDAEGKLACGTPVVLRGTDAGHLLFAPVGAAS